MLRLVILLGAVACLTNPVRAEFVSADMLRAVCSYQSLPENVRAGAKQICHTTIRAYLVD